MTDYQVVTGNTEELYDVINAGQYEDIYISIKRGTNDFLFVKQDYDYIRDAIDQMDNDTELQWYIDNNMDLVLDFE